MGLFKDLFGSGRGVERRSGFGLCLDFHLHILPMLDDGASSIDESVAMVLAMKQLGFNKFIATPHVRAEVFPNTKATISLGYDKLMEALTGVDVKIVAAAEYMFDEGFDKIVQKGDLLTFGDNHVLIELSHIMNVGELWQTIFDLQIAGYRVVLAHPERYGYLNMEVYEELKERGVLFQLNGVSLVGAYGHKAQSVAEKFIDNGWIELIGSDLHSPRAVEVYRKVCATKYYSKLFASGCLINDNLL